MPRTTHFNRQRVVSLICLIFAGEMIFSLPFHVARFFRPTLLDVFQLSNARLGDVFAVYGVTAMLCYFPGGALADRYPARHLIAGSLIATALGGVYLATFPAAFGLALLYGYWGITTILLFWAALIRATRDWGGEFAQGRAFGLLEGGRGLAAAAFATAGVVILGNYFMADRPSLDARAEGLRIVIYFYAAITGVIGVLCARFIPASHATSMRRQKITLIDVLEVVRVPAIWLQAFIVVAAYCGYKGLDYYTLFAHQRLGLSELASANFMANCAYLRPLAAVAAGFFADRVRASVAVMVAFALAGIGYLVLAFAQVQARDVLYANVVITVVAVYGLRGVYFALLGESGIPARNTGTAVGLISVVGYLPDVFFAPLAGRLLDQGVGQNGFQQFFLLLTGIMAVGMLVSCLISSRRDRRTRPGARRSNSGTIVTTSNAGSCGEGK